MPVDPPHVRLGRIADGGLAPAVLALIERGVRQRPELAQAFRAEIEFEIVEDYPPVRVVFGEGQVLVEDAAAERPDLRIRGRLGDLVSLTLAPLVGGIPSPVRSRGRAALSMVAMRRVKVRGRVTVMRRLLSIIRI